jgi:hypothetical protein
LGLALDEPRDQFDTSFSQDDINFLVEKNLQNMIGNTTPLVINYTDSVYGAGFTIDYRKNRCHE